MRADLERALAEPDAELGVHPVFFTVRSSEVGYVLSVLESYESIGVTRSHDSLRGDGRVLMVAMLVPDFVTVARQVLDELAATTELDFVEATARLVDDLRAVLTET